ncbi:MAG: hypothetical protein IJM25_02220 [Eubacterium sp.]|nr:hypothetical protein [Eubacterium sp.]
MEKRSIGIKKILIDCVRFWFLLVLFAGAGAFLGYRGTLSYNQGIDKQIKENEKKQQEELEAQMELTKDIVEEKTFTKEECEKGLSKSAMKDVQEAYHWYQEKEKRRDYLETSPYLQLDPYNVTASYLQFRVNYDGESVDELDFASYVHALKNYVNYNGLVDDLQGEIETTSRDLSELISFGDGGKDSYDRIVLITVIHSSITEDLIDHIGKAFLAYGNKLSDTYPGFSVEKMSTYQANYYHSGLNSSIESQRAALISDQNRVDNAVKKLTSMQLAYYNMLINGTDKETVEEVIPEGATSKRKATTEIEVPSKRRILPMMILGAVGGCILAVVLIFFGNLLSGKLLFEKDLTSIYGLRSYGVLREKEKKGIAGFLQRAEYPGAEPADSPAMLYLQLKEAVGASESKEAILISSSKLGETEGVKKLVELAKKDGIAFSVKDSFIGDLSAAEEVLKGHPVFMVEQLHGSRLSKVDRIAAFCKENKVQILGGICVDA